MKPVIRGDRNVLNSCSVLNCGEKNDTKRSWIYQLWCTDYYLFI